MVLGSWTSARPTRLAERWVDAAVVDVEGRTVVPGLIDAHNHFLATGESLSSVDARYPGVGSIDELIRRIKQAASRTAPDTWITAAGFDDAKVDRPLTRWDLDRATTEHPVMVLHVSGHHAFVNSDALERRGVTDDTPDPQGGRLVRDGGGRLTGQCLDAAMNLILPVSEDIGAHGPNFHTVTTVEGSVTNIVRASHAFLEAGLTTVCDPQVTRRELIAYREARRQGKLGVRTVCMPLSHQLEDWLSLGLAGPFGDDHLSIGAIKSVCPNGSFDRRVRRASGVVRATGANSKARMYWSPAELEEMIVALRRRWLAGPWVHVQGDARWARRWTRSSQRCGRPRGSIAPP